IRTGQANSAGQATGPWAETGAQLSPHGEVNAKALSRVADRLGQIQTNRPYRRHPANADARAGLHRVGPAVHGVTVVHKGRSTPFGDEFVLVFETAGEHETATNPVASLVSRRQRPVVIATHALVTTGEEAQRCRHTGESVAGDAPSLQTPQEPMPFMQRI